MMVISGLRKIHLDFHTHAEVRGVCAQFDAEQFAATLAEARVNAVVLFAKDAYGHAYLHGTGCAPHPQLEQDFLPLAVAACHRRNIRTEAYVGVGLDTVAALAHPDWACRTAAGEVCRWGDPLALLDPASPVIAERVLPFAADVLRLVPVDALWFDIVMYPTDGFYGPFLTAELQRRGLPDTPVSRGALARDVVVEVQQRMREFVRGLAPAVRVLFNNQVYCGDTRALPHNDVIDLESDPSYWPLYDLSLRCRYLHSQGHPFTALTTRFHRCWGDFGGLRAPVELQFELGSCLAAGCPDLAVGDHLHPNGRLEPAVYRLIGEAFEHCRKIAPWVRDARPWADVAVLVPRDPLPYSGGRDHLQHAQLGAVRALVECHVPFAVQDLAAPLRPGQVALLPGGERLLPEEVERVKQLVADGHPVLAFGQHVRGLEPLVHCPEAAETALAGQYLYYQKDLLSDLLREMPVALYRKVLTFRPRGKTEVIAHSLDPLFDQRLAMNYHAYGPVDYQAPPRPAIVARDRVVLCGVDFPRLVHTDGAWAFLHAIHRLLRRLKPEPGIETDAGPTIEVAVHEKGQDLIVHLVAGVFPRVGQQPARMRRFQPQRQITVQLQTAAPPREVKLLTPGRLLTWDRTDCHLYLRLDLVQPHTVVLCLGAGGPPAPTA